MALTVKLSVSTGPATRMIEAPGTTGQLGQAVPLQNGHIFILDQSGNVVNQAAMNVAQATGTGQQITGAIAPNSRVYVLANIPSSVDVTTLTSWQRIQQTVVTISASQQNNYRTAALANASGQPAGITTGTGAAGTGTVTVEISPLYSRFELTDVRGGPTIQAFNVTGVFVDSYFPSFTLDGQPSGPIHYQAQSTNFAGSFGDGPPVTTAPNAGPWAATGTAGNMVATAGAGMVWAYHVAAADLPRFIVRLENIQTTGGTTIAGPRYITVSSYSGQAPTRFERGRIYQVSLPFTEAQLAMTPNPSYVTITAQVRVVDWIPTQLTPVI